MSQVVPASLRSSPTGQPGFNPPAVAAPRARAGMVLYSALAVALLIAVLVVTSLRPLMLPDEGRYVGVALEMINSGNWTIPTLDGLPYFQKPPLFYWITAASLSVFGTGQLAARLAPLLGAGITAVALFLFARRWSDPTRARNALVVLLAQPLFLCAGQFANLDMLVAGLITATIALLAHSVLAREEGQPRLAPLLAAYAFAGFGVLAKGLIGAVIPGMVIGAWLLATRRWRAIGPLFSWRGAALFAAIAVPWFVAAQQRYDGFFDYFFVVQHFRRFTSTGFNNAQPIWFYAAVLAGVFLPWAPWLYRQLRPQSVSIARDPVRPLMLLWLGVVLAFFSIPQSKLLGYILPTMAPLAWLVSDGAARAGKLTAGMRTWWWGAAGLGVATMLALVIGLTLMPRNSAREIAEELQAHRAQGEPVMMLGRFDFDVAFYARLREPILVVDAWSSADVQHRDNWRKELADAARFDPVAAKSRLVDSKDLVATLCRAPVTWIIASSGMENEIPILAHGNVVFNKRGTNLWRIEQAALVSAKGAKRRSVCTREQARGPDAL